MHKVRRRDPRAAKQRDIARSILPSTSRRAARRALRDIRQADRRAVNAALLPLRDARVGTSVTDCCAPAGLAGGGPGVAGGCVDFWSVAMPDYPVGEHGYEIARRREFDKVGPVIRWAGREVHGMGTSDARRHLVSVLPDGLIGRHAMTHLDRSLRLDPTLWSGTRPAERPADDLRGVLRSMGQWAITHGRHRELNQQIARHLGDTASSRTRTSRGVRHGGRATAGAASRPLLGLHDLDDWSEATNRLADRDARRFGSDRIRRWRHLRKLAPIAAWASELGWEEPTR